MKVVGSPLGWTLVAGVAAGVAVLLAAAPSPVRVHSVRASPGHRVLAAATFGGAGVLGLGWWAWPLSGTDVALVVIVAAATLPAVGLVKRHRQAKAAARVAARVAETADLVAAELGVGVPPGQALVNACESWPVLAPVVEAERLGADVPTAWREVSTLRGAHQLQQVGAAWEVAARTGGGLADAMTRVAEAVRADRVTARTIASELASARATARLIAVLPVAALVMGTSQDSQPFVFLVTEPLGLTCLAGGLACGLAGLWWIERIAAGVER